MNIFKYYNYRDFLQDYYQTTKEKNKLWSYAAWCAKMNVPCNSTLIKVVRGSRAPGKELIQKLGEYFSWNSDELSYFKILVALELIDIDVSQKKSILNCAVNAVLLTS